MNSNLAEKLPEEIAAQSMTLYEQALTLTISDQPSFAAAGEFGKSLKDLEKKIVDFFAPIKKAAHEAHKAVTKKESEELAPVQEAMSIVRKTMNIFLQEQERIRKEEERKARLAAEEAARKEQERLFALAAKAEEKGKEEKAEELLERAENVYVAPVTVAPKVEIARFDGGNVGQVKELQVSVTDLKAFLAELVKRNLAPTMVTIGAAPLKAWVKANAMQSFPGLAIVETVSVRIR